MKITDMTYELTDDVYNIEKESFATPWSKKSFEDECKNEIAKYFVAISGTKGVGYIGMWEVCGQCDITNIAVLPDYRRQGIAGKLICHLIEYCRQKSLSPITLEVRESNSAAISLYKSFKFSPIGHRKKYYSDTGEDAIIMALEL